MKTKIIIAFILLLTSGRLTWADSRQSLDKPLMFGPQYPLLFLSTVFEPDSAFLIKTGDFFLATSYILLNSYVYSESSAKADDPSAPASQFNNTDSTGYSIYFDGEMERRFLKLYYGFSDNIEFQFTYQDFRFVPGSLDGAIENFHQTLNIDNQGRDNTDRDLLEIYVHDNETGKNVFIITQPSDKFVQQSMTLGVKVKVKETAKEAISLSLSSNFGDQYIEQELNEATTDTQNPEYKNFNDYNFTLRYSSLFEAWSLHSAFSVSYVGNSLLEKSPDSIYYFFLGANWHISANWDFILQALEYSSPFPKDKSTIADDIREITTGLRWFIANNAVLELGFTENQSQGPQNIDITFFSTLMFYL